MKKNYTKAIKTIINFKKVFNNIDLKIPTGLLGEIGEFYVLRELQKLGFEPEHKGGQAGYDIYVGKLDKKIEVKTSLLKNEGVFPNKEICFWGWAIERRNQKKTNKFDYLVCAALNNNFTKPRFYIFTHKEAFSVGNVEIGRFKNVKKKIYLFENKIAYQKAIKLEPKLITPFEKVINRDPSRFLNKWKKIQ